MLYKNVHHFGLLIVYTTHLRHCNLNTFLQWLPWQLAAILEFKVATTESYISAYLSIQTSYKHDSGVYK